MRKVEWARRAAALAVGAATLTTLTTLGGCMHVSQRAIRNGQYINAEGNVLYGNYSIRNARDSFGQLDPLPFKHQSNRPYTFGFRSR